MGCLPLYSLQDPASSGMIASRKPSASAQPSLQLQVRCYPSDEGSDSCDSQSACTVVPSTAPGRYKYSRSTCRGASRASDCGRKSLRRGYQLKAAACKQLVSKQSHSEDSSLHDINPVLHLTRRTNSSSRRSDDANSNACKSTAEAAGAAADDFSKSRLAQDISGASTAMQTVKSSSRSFLPTCCLKPQCDADSGDEQPLVPVAISQTTPAPKLGPVVAEQQSITAACAGHAVQADCRGSSCTHGGCSDSIAIARVAAAVKPTVEIVEVKAAPEPTVTEPPAAAKTDSHLPLVQVISPQPACIPVLSISSDSASAMQQHLQANPAPGAPTTDSISWSYGSSSEQNGRTHMEDRVLTADLTSDVALAGAERAVLLGVFDGHAGSATAQYLSSSMVGHLLAEGGAALHQDPADSIVRAVGCAEGELLASWDPTTGPASGSTLCMGLVLGSVLRVAHAGDSRAVLARSGRALQLTQDHKPSSEAERARIHAADPSAQVSSDGYMYGELGVSRGMGSAHIKGDPTKSAYIAAPELRSIQLEERDDFLILASDGLWDVMSSSEAVTAARKSLAAKRDAPAAAAVLVERAKQLGSADNISVVVMLLHGRPITLAASNSRLFRRPAPAATAVEAAP